MDSVLTVNTYISSEKLSKEKEPFYLFGKVVIITKENFLQYGNKKFYLSFFLSFSLGSQVKDNSYNISCEVSQQISSKKVVRISSTGKLYG